MSQRKRHKTHRWRQVTSQKNEIPPIKSQKTLVKFYEVKMKHCKEFHIVFDMSHVEMHCCILHKKGFQTKKNGL